MGAAPGIAGSSSPEIAGCFLCEGEAETEWFVRLNNTGGAVDVWAVDGLAMDDLPQSPNGYVYVPRCVAPEHVRLVRRDMQEQDP